MVMIGDSMVIFHGDLTNKQSGMNVVQPTWRHLMRTGPDKFIGIYWDYWDFWDLID